MKDQPIILSGPMVLATLEDRKTQTRRVIIPQPPPDPDEVFFWVQSDPVSAKIAPSGFWARKHGAAGYLRFVAKCRYGQPDDRLWVRETWRIGAWDEDAGRICVDYQADNSARRDWLEVSDDHDGEKFNRYWMQTCDELEAKGIKRDGNGDYHWKPGESPCRWRPSIFMPRWASRITLEVTKIRTERLQQISEEDAKAEGAKPAFESDDDGLVDRHPSYRNGFKCLWDSLNAKRAFGWDVNPWVGVLEFRIQESAA